MSDARRSSDRARALASVHDDYPESIHRRLVDVPRAILEDGILYAWADHTPEEDWHVLCRDLVERLHAADANAKRGPGPGPSLSVTRASEIRPSEVEWLWPGRLPRGRLVTLDGAPDQGKSTLALDVAARLSAGRPMPDGWAPGSPCPVVVLSAEDDPADTIVPRLIAAGANLDQVLIMEAMVNENGAERPLTLPDDAPMVGDILRQNSAGLLVIDVLMAFLRDRTDTYRDHDIRRALLPLTRVCAEIGTTLLVIRHTTKQPRRAVNAGGGSIAIIGAARAGLLVGEDPGDSTRSVLAVVKSNLGSPGQRASLAYRLEPHEQNPAVARVQWSGPVTLTADELAAATIGASLEIDRACAFLRTQLAEDEVPVQKLQEEAKQAGLSWRTIERAKQRLGVAAVKTGQPRSDHQRWMWRLAEHGHVDADDRHRPAWRPSSEHSGDSPASADEALGNVLRASPGSQVIYRPA